MSATPMSPDAVSALFFSLFLVFVFFVPADFSGARQKGVALSVAFVVLLLLAAFRYLVPDLGNYEDTFRGVPRLLEEDFFRKQKELHGEYGYLLLNSVIKTLGGEFTAVVLVCASIAVALNFVSIAKLSPFPVISVLLYFSHIYLNKELILMRTGIASAIVLFALYAFCVHRSYVRFALYILLASLFHIAALVAFAVLAVVRANIPLRFLLYALIASFAMALIGWYPTDITIKVLSYFGVLPDQFLQYIGYESYDYTLGALNPKTIQQLTFTLVLYRFRDTVKIYVPAFDVMLAMYMVSTLVLIVFADFAILAARLATMLSNVEFILLPCLLFVFEKRGRPLAYVGLIVMGALMLYQNLQSGRLPNYENYLFDWYWEAKVSPAV